MKNIFERVIARGNYNLNGILERIDEYHIEGKLTDEERVHLITAARGDATPGMDVAQEIQLLWAAVRDLQADMAESKDEIEDGIDEADVPEFESPTGAHDAYYYGSLCRYNDELYMCIAPEGVACVWSPDAMPDYWQVM